MANLLTGDFEAVLQVSADTVNRLLASMHQNAWQNPDTPSFPHSTGLRLGDVVMVEAVRGTAWAQVGVPRMTLVDRATDRFLLEVGLRIRYLPDEDTEPLATYLHGTLRAMYVLEEIDPTCPGWRKLASQYLWVRVDPDSVSWDGATAASDNWTSLGIIDQDQVAAAVTTQLRTLLEYAYEAAPQKVQPGFGRGSFMSINQGYGEVDEVGILSGLVPPVPVGGSAVAIPVGLTSDPPLWAINSINHVLLAQRDFALAVSVDTIMGQIDPALDEIRNYKQTFNVSGDFGSTVYRAYVSSASAVWVPHGSYAEIAVTVTGGADTDSILPNIGFTVNQRFQTDFDPGAETIRLWAAGNTVQATASGVGLPSSVLHDIATTIANVVESRAESAAAAAAPALQQFTSGTAGLVEQLRKLDAKADAHLDDATFHLSGVVLRGWVSVARRRKPVVSFQKIDDNTFSALDSWIPGGRIDRLTWTWGWGDFGGESDPLRFDDRFALTRPPSYDRTKFGAYVGGEPLPGLDGVGHVCLVLKGHVVDVTTGQLVPITTVQKCVRFGYAERFRNDVGSLFLRDWAVIKPGGPPHEPDPPEPGMLDVSTHRPAPGAPNTLLIHIDEPNPAAFASTLRDGLAGCGRKDAGLHVLVLFREGALAGAGADVEAQLRALTEGLDAQLIVNEDVHGSWSRAFAIPASNGEPSWRLLSPDGGVLWMEDGPVSSDELAGVLDHRLYPSGNGAPTPIEVDLGARLKSPDWLGHIFDHPPHFDHPNCPPFNGIHPLDLVTVAGAVSFVRHDAASPEERIRMLRAEHGHRTEDGPGVVVVLDGASPAEARAMNDELGPVFTVVGDEDGSRARTIGVRYWPTTVTLDDHDHGDTTRGEMKLT